MSTELTFQRDMSATLEAASRNFPIVVLTGPRQSGKTTLLRQQFPSYQYFNLEFPDTRALVEEDPRGVIERYRERGLIIDEAQRYPDIFSYLQGYVDEQPQPGQFLLSGSQNMLLADQLSQSLAGRAAWLELLPLTWREYCSGDSAYTETDLWQWLYSGSYPRPYRQGIPTASWYQAYMRTYLERDVRSLLKVHDLNQFQAFIRLCAGRHGQILNITQLASDAGISHTAARHWLSVLEASYIIFLLKPYYNNFNKRIVKSPKLYFYDSAMVCQLLGIDSPNHLSLHSQRGAIFEGLVITTLVKQFMNSGQAADSIYYWRDAHGHEVDCLIERQGKLYAYEIKSSMTIRPEFFRGLRKFAEIANVPLQQMQLVYGGSTAPAQGEIDVVTWRDI